MTVEVAVSLLYDPRILFFDSPFKGSDVFFYIVYAILNMTFAANPDFNLNTIIIRVDTEGKDKVLQLGMAVFFLSKIVGVALFIKGKIRSN
jgi:ABC-type transporter Mla maintaining outer membrane lipid asymmetry ATPase subunit MlaF